MKKAFEQVRQLFNDMESDLNTMASQLDTISIMSDEFLSSYPEGDDRLEYAQHADGYYQRLQSFINELDGAKYHTQWGQIFGALLYDAASTHAAGIQYAKNAYESDSAADYAAMVTTNSEANLLMGMVRAAIALFTQAMTGQLPAQSTTYEIGEITVDTSFDPSMIERFLKDKLN